VVLEEYRTSRSLDVYGNFLYFMDVSAGTLVRVDKDSGRAKEVLVTGLKSPSSVRTVSTDQKYAYDRFVITSPFVYIE